ncbi:MAG: putative T6SS immunity periplasmic lipoprotein [Serratia fonticola]
MVMKIKWPGLLSLPFALFCLQTLTGCPGVGDRMRFDETAQVRAVGDKVCFSVSEAQDYQPAIISINPRNTTSFEKKFTDNPNLSVKEGVLCIPPAFYRFPDKGQFIVEYVLTSPTHRETPRKVVVGLEISQGRIYNVPLTDMEISRPYSEVNKQ